MVVAVCGCDLLCVAIVDDQFGNKAFVAGVGSGLCGRSVSSCLHQYFVTLPANRLLYQQDPDAVVALAGSMHHPALLSGWYLRIA